MFYVYLHTRNDTGEIFYVGKGQGRRAYSIRNRNTHWKGIVNLHGRTVRIHSEHLNELSAFECEVNLIQELKSSGCCLVNLTDGGEGVSGRVLTDHEKLMVSMVHSGKKLSPEHKEKLNGSVRGRPSHRRGKPFPCCSKYPDELLLTLEKEFGKPSVIARKYGVPRTLVSKLKRHKIHTYLWK